MNYIIDINTKINLIIYLFLDRNYQEAKKMMFIKKC